MWYQQRLEASLEGIARQATAAATCVWLGEAWPRPGERDAVREQIWRGLREWSSEAAGAYGWIGRALESARGLAATHEHALGPRACGYLGAGLMWSWWVGRVHGAPLERVSLEVVDGVVWPGRFTAAPLHERSANDVPTVRFELIAGRMRCEPVAGHEPGRWVARAAAARAGGAILTWSGASIGAPARG